MGAGELRVSGGATKLMEADFDYNDPGSKPQVEYHSTGVRSDIDIHPSGTVQHGESKWDMRFNDSAGMDLVVKMGAGEAHLNLGSMNLRSVAFDLGAGEVTWICAAILSAVTTYDQRRRRTGDRPPAQDRWDLSHGSRRYRRDQRPWAGEAQRPVDQSGSRERAGDHPPGCEGRRRPDRPGRRVAVRATLTKVSASAAESIRISIPKCEPGIGHVIRTPDSADLIEGVVVRPLTCGPTTAVTFWKSRGWARAWPPDFRPRAPRFPPR